MCGFVPASFSRRFSARSGMTSPAFAKFSFGAGLVAPEPGPVVGAVASVAGAVSVGVPSPKTPPPVSIESIMKDARVPPDLIKEVLTHLNADGDTLPDHWHVFRTKISKMRPGR